MELHTFPFTEWRTRQDAAYVIRHGILMILFWQNLPQQKKTVEITVQDLEDRDILNLTDGDIARYNFIMRNFQAADEARVLSFVMELNNKIFYGLNKASKRNVSLEPINLPKIGLDPSDFLFFQELVRFYDLEITPVVPCCYGCCV